MSKRSKNSPSKSKSKTKSSSNPRGVIYKHGLIGHKLNGLILLSSKKGTLLDTIEEDSLFKGRLFILHDPSTKTDLKYVP